MSKCLRCGAGAEWIQGRVPNEQPEPDVDREIGSAMTQAVSDARLDELQSILLKLPGAERWQSEAVIALGELKASRQAVREARETLAAIMHARRDPNVALTDMSRAGMRELAGAWLEAHPVED